MIIFYYKLLFGNKKEVTDSYKKV